MTVYYMSFVDSQFLGACLVHADTPEDAVHMAWQRDCNPGGEVAILVPEFIPDEKWFYRILSRAELAEMETELNQKYHGDKPRKTPGIYQ